MKLAVIDMGTNTFHLLIAAVDKGLFRVLLRERKAVKIGEKGINDGKITAEAETRAIDAMRFFKDIIDEFQVDVIHATATSAIRNASNGNELVSKVKAATGINVHIISGMEEAEYIYYGVKRAVSTFPETSLIMDIGGGSCEFIITGEQQPVWMQSFEIGGQRLVETFHDADPISSSAIQHLRAHFAEHLAPLHEAVEKYEPTTLVGCSGTFDTLSDIYCFEEAIERSLEPTELPLTMDGFRNAYKQLLAKTREERLAIPGMIEMRVDMIVVASILVDYVLKTCNIQQIRVSSYALKEGVLLSLLDRISELDVASQKKPTH